MFEKKSQETTIIQEGTIQKGNVTNGPITPKPAMPIKGFSPKGSPASQPTSSGQTVTQNPGTESSTK